MSVFRVKLPRIQRGLPDMMGTRTLGWALLVAAALTVPAIAAAAGKQAQAKPPAAAQTQADPEVRQALEAWRLAWELGEASTYLRFYDPSFQPQRGSRTTWEKQRRARLARKDITVKLEDVRTTRTGDDAVEVRFVQHYTAGRIKDVGEKRLKMKRVNGAWRITQETWSRR